MVGTRARRLRLKADGRIVEILADGRERALPADEAAARPASPAPPAAGPAAAAIAPAVRPLARGGRAAMKAAPARTIAAEPDAVYARRVRAATKLTQAEFALRLGVPIETVRNWEQGKRSPRGPARALLKVIDSAPDLAFAAIAGSRGSR
jgi:putative transcriptional regulator